MIGIIKQVDVAGVTSPVLHYGLESATEAVVFVHGNPGASEDWCELLPQAGACARAIAPDMPGYGKAPRPRDFSYTVEGYANHLDGILKALGITRVHLVLHDFGGPWGLHWAAQNPGKVASLSLINAGILPGYRWHALARIWRKPVIGELFVLLSTRAALRRLLNATNPQPFPEAFIDRIHAASDWGYKRAVLKLYRATSDLGTLADALIAKLKPLTLPCLVLWGEHDPYLPVRFAALQKDFFSAEVHALSGSGHWPMIDEPQRTAELLVPFLRRQVAMPGACP